MFRPLLCSSLLYQYSQILYADDTQISISSPHLSPEGYVLVSHSLLNFSTEMSEGHLKFTISKPKYLSFPSIPTPVVFLILLNGVSINQLFMTKSRILFDSSLTSHN